jgi:glycosyltransferase involved in cell wall biosynthesis
VTLLPYQKNPFAILNKCDVFVMPSMFEGYCNALCEALICGLPCIATDFQSSAREIIAPGTPINYQIKMGIEYAEYGIITPVCSGTKYKGNEPLENAEQDLADAMLALYKDKEIFNNYKLKANIRANQFDINKKVQEWIELV